jgi:outer membrane protein OmpA-like peptidoglycan-associated protein
LSERDSLEQQVLRFPVNSAQIGVEQLVKLDDIEVLLINLQQNANSIGQKFAIDIRGHADPTGSEEKNAALSQARADAVLNVLVTRGLPRAMFRTEAVGSRDPVHRASEADIAGLNRRVSFHVILGPEPPR